MATPTSGSGQQTADVPRTGGYTRFELELEVRLLSYPIPATSCAPGPLRSINKPLVCAVSCESCLS